MSRATRREKAEHELAALEERFRTTLIDGLREASQGYLGIFGDNEFLDQSIYRSAARKELLDLMTEISDMRTGLGFVDPFDLGARYFALCKRSGPNDPGERKRAQTFLEELAACHPERSEA